MEIIENRDGDTLTVRIVGRLDTNTAPELDGKLKGDVDGVRTLILDLSGLEYISSAGLRVVLSTNKVMSKQGGMKVVNVQDTVMEVFEATGFTDVLDIE